MHLTTFEKEDFLENSHPILFYLIKKLLTLFVFLDLFQIAGNQLCFRFFFFLKRAELLLTSSKLGKGMVVQTLMA